MLALLILWREHPGTEDIFRSGSSINGNRLWMTSSGGRQANVNSPSSSKDLLVTDNWHTLVRVSTGQELRQYVNGLRTRTTAVTAAGSWSI